ncbi:MAG: hypothetical protein PW734_09235 [Verrucomicrobium sp.]|nr:hypothetical protein [Verrucomicrobium sp.]
MASPLYPQPTFAADPELASFVAQIPKTETHLHLEGALPFLLLQEKDPKKPLPEFWAADFRYRDFGHFLGKILDPEANYYTSAAHYGRAAGLIFGGLAAQNVRYVESIVHLPTIVEADGGPLAVLDAIRQAAADHAPGLSLKIKAGMTRDNWATHAGPIQEALKWKELDGVGIHGTEEIPFEPWTAAMWRRFRDAGKFTEVHAGEFGSVESVRHAATVLGVDRIEHGIAAVKDPELMALLKEKKIGLDVCPISNWRLRAVESLAAHPLPVLHRAGLLCTLSTDDPYFFGNTLSEEYARAVRDVGLSRAEVLQLARNGFEVARIPDAAKAEPLAELARLAAKEAGPRVPAGRERVEELQAAPLRPAGETGRNLPDGPDFLRTR